MMVLWPEEELSKKCILYHKYNGQVVKSMCNGKVHVPDLINAKNQDILFVRSDLIIGN